MKTSNKSAADHHAAKRRWLNSHEEGYHKAMGNRQVQMIAIGGAIGTGLFLGAFLIYCCCCFPMYMCLHFSLLPLNFLILLLVL